MSAMLILSYWFRPDSDQIPSFIAFESRKSIMAFSPSQKSEVIDEFRAHEADTGSARVQIALLTRRINDLTEHFRKHPQDHHGRQGLLKMVGRRRRLLDYVKRTDVEAYRRILGELQLRK